MEQAVVWLIEKVFVTNYIGPVLYYKGGPLKFKEIEFQDTDDPYKAAGWQTKEGAEEVTAIMLGGKAYHWEAREHVFML